MGGRISPPLTPLQKKKEDPKEHLEKSSGEKEQKLVVDHNFQIPSTLSPAIDNKSDLRTLPTQKTEDSIEVKKESDRKDISSSTPASDVTVRVPLPSDKNIEKKEEAKKAVPKKSKVKFIITLLIFGIIAISGIFYFFSGDIGVGDMALMSARGGKVASPEGKNMESAHTVQEQPKNVQKEEQPSNINTASKVSENVKKSIEIVKNYALSDGRGSISNWFSNNFSSSKQVSEEWNSTLLQDNIFVVQYRVIRPKQDPLVYQFEVDVEKGNINRGINNNAIELLESSKKEVVKKQLPPKGKKKQVAMAKPKGKGKNVPLLPLPEKDDSDSMNEPTGLENADTITTGKVKINAPESDEELF